MREDLELEMKEEGWRVGSLDASQVLYANSMDKRNLAAVGYETVPDWEGDLTWEELAEIEPAFWGMHEMLKHMVLPTSGSDEDQKRIWFIKYHILRPWINVHAGWGCYRLNSVLRSNKAYVLAQDVLYGLLPTGWKD